jgi:hypothetical protein
LKEEEGVEEGENARKAKEGNIKNWTYFLLKKILGQHRKGS